MDSTMIKSLAGNTKAVLTNEKDLISKKPSTFTASFSNIEKVYSLFPGKVIYIGFYKNMGTVMIAVSDNEIVRYLNLDSIEVVSSQVVKKGTYLGSVNQKNGLQLEYCSQWRGSSVRPVRLENRTWFKQNPISIINGSYTPEYNYDIVRGYNQPNDIIDLTDEQKEELSANSSFSDTVEIDITAYQINELSGLTPEIIAEFSNNY